MNTSDRFLIFVLIAAAAAAGFLAIGRVEIERSNHTVEIILDADDVRRVAGGRPVTEALAKFREAGATALGVREVTMQELLDSGRVTAGHSPDGVWVDTPTGEYAREVAAAIQGKLPSAKVAADGTVVRMENTSLDLLKDAPLLLRPEDVEAAGAAGLRVVARLGNFPNVTPRAIAASLAQAKRAGARLVIFRDDQVLGYRSSIKQAAADFRDSDMIYGRIEIAVQKGEEELARLVPGRRVRVHSINDTEIETMAEPTAVERYARAVRERGIRACYVRLLTDSAPDPVAANASYVAGIVRAIRHADFRIGPPAPLSAPEQWPSRAARLATLVGVAAGLVLLLRRLVPVSPTWSWALFAAAAVVLLGLGVMDMDDAAKVGGLAAAAAFPSLGVIAALQWARRGLPAYGVGEVLRRAGLGLLLASAASFAGGMLIVGMYAEPRYLEAVGQFTGVKLSLIAPVLIVLLAAAMDLSGDPQPLRVWWEEVRDRVRGALATPVAWGAAAALIIALGAAVLVVMRSGNDAAVAPSGAELQMRQTLENLLIARPRTKEFLFGHPALMLGVALALRRRRAWLPLVAAVAAVGQGSLLNTFCHLHMPLYLGLLRTGHGLWIGAVIGAAAIVVWQAAVRRRQWVAP